MNGNDFESCTGDEYRQKHDQLKWEEWEKVIQIELNSPTKGQVFRPIV